MTRKHTYIDLFSGCGGLSLGLETAGFSLELAVEKSSMAAETFYHNFIERIKDNSKWEKFCSLETSVLDQAKKKLVVKELEAVLESQELIQILKDKNIDLIAGGPPCQGFSLAGRRNPKDIRNQLPWQFIELVKKIQPKAVIIENVSGMKQNFVKHNQEAPFEQLRIALSKSGIGYMVQPVFLNAKHFGVPQNRPRVMLIALRKDVGKVLGIKTYEKTWKSDYDQLSSIPFPSRPELAPLASFFGENILTVRDAIWDLNDKNYIVSFSNKKYSMPKNQYANRIRSDISWMHEGIISSKKPTKISNHNLRNHAKHIQLRFRLYQYLQLNNIPTKILSIPKQPESTLASIAIQLKEHLTEPPLPAKSPDGYILASTVDELIKLIIELATKKHSQRPLRWDAPAPTIVSLPDDFVHPDLPRTLSVREMARFQSFPDSFEFRAKETTGGLKRRTEVPQYTQVGNAVPPIMAQAVGQVLNNLLKNYTEIINNNNMKKTG